MGSGPPPTGPNNAYGVRLSYAYKTIPERAFQLAAVAGLGGVRAVLNWDLVEPMPGRCD